MHQVNRIRKFGCILCNTLRCNYSKNSAKRASTNDASNDKKKENAKILRRYNEENSVLFGNLLETLPQKRKREKRTPLHDESITTNESNKNAEAHWWKTFQGKDAFYQKSQLQMGVHISRRLDAKSCHDLGKKSSVGSNCDIYMVNAESSKGSIDCSNAVKENTMLPKLNLKLPPVIVKNITTFPLENKYKKLCDSSRVDSLVSLPIKRERAGFDNQYKVYPSVTKILNATMSDAARDALQKWKENLISELGEEGFISYQKALLEDGRKFHSTVQTFLTDTSRDETCVEASMEGCWNSLRSTLKNIGSVHVIESHVVHQELLYHGIIDCIATYRNKLLLIDWKKSDKQKSHICSTYDAPLQVAAYLGAVNFDKNYNLKVKGGLVVVAYTNGSPAHVHHMDKSLCQKYWYMWLRRLQMYWNMVNYQDTLKNMQNNV